MEYSKYIIEVNCFSLQSAVNVYLSILFLKVVHDKIKIDSLNENNYNNLLKWFFYLISSLSIKSLKIVNFIGIEKRELSLIVDLLGNNNNTNNKLTKRINENNIYEFYLSLDILKQIQVNFTKNIQLQVNDIVIRFDNNSNNNSNGISNISYCLKFLSIESISNCVINDVIVLIHHYNTQSQNIHQIENNSQDIENSHDKIFNLLVSFIYINKNTDTNTINDHNLIKKQIIILRTLGWSLIHCFVSLNILKYVNVIKNLTFSEYFLKLLDNFVKYEERISVLNKSNNDNNILFVLSNCQLIMVSLLSSCLHNSTNLITQRQNSSSFDNDMNMNISMNEQVKQLSSSLSINIISIIRRNIIKKLQSVFDTKNSFYIGQIPTSQTITYLDENYNIDILEKKKDIKDIAGKILIKLISLELNSQFPFEIAEKTIQSFISLNVIS